MDSDYLPLRDGTSPLIEKNKIINLTVLINMFFEIIISIFLISSIYNEQSNTISVSIVLICIYIVDMIKMSLDHTWILTSENRCVHIIYISIFSMIVVAFNIFIFKTNDNSLLLKNLLFSLISLSYVPLLFRFFIYACYKP